MYLAKINMVVGRMSGTVYSKGFMNNFLKCGELESYGLKETMASLLAWFLKDRLVQIQD